MHIPVLQKEVIQFLAPKPNENFIDCTIGGGGHAFDITEKILPDGKLLGIDWDEGNIRRLKFKIQNFPISSRIPDADFIGIGTKFKINLILVCDNFVNLKEIVKREKFGKVAGILFDLGLSSWHLEESGRGFSFQKNEPLDMRYEEQERDRRGTVPQTAEKIINDWSEKEIERILREYGEERFAKRITEGIIGFRKIKPIRTTFQLVEIIRKAVPGFYERGRIHPATRTFQALRLAVNDELKNLEKTLPQALETLEPEGRLVLISFHSLEDRLVKNFLKNNKLRLKILTKKPISPSLEEIRRNPRSRSAKLRAAIKL